MIRFFATRAQLNSLEIYNPAKSKALILSKRIELCVDLRTGGNIQSKPNITGSSMSVQLCPPPPSQTSLYINQPSRIQSLHIALFHLCIVSIGFKGSLKKKTKKRILQFNGTRLKCKRKKKNKPKKTADVFVNPTINTHHLGARLPDCD